MIDADHAAGAADVAPPQARWYPPRPPRAPSPPPAAPTRGRPHPAHRSARCTAAIPAARACPAACAGCTASQRERHLRAGGDHEALRRALAVERAHSRRGAMAVERRRVARICGRPWRVRTSAVGPAACSMAAHQATARLDRIGRPPQRQVRDQPQAVQMLDRLVRRAVLAQTDRIVACRPGCTRWCISAAMRTALRA